MASTTPPDPWPLPELHRARRAIVVVDVVESVRLMQEDESGFIDRWRRFVHEVRTGLLPAHGGRMVKSLGDGMLLELQTANSATLLALALHQRMDAINGVAPAGRHVFLRVGIHLADVLVDEIDIYGAGVNVAARLVELASPGGTVASVEVRDGLVDGMHIEVQDLGECYVKHLAQPLRAFALHPFGSHPVARAKPAESHLAVLAIVPFRPTAPLEHAGALGDVLAMEVIGALSKLAGLQLISRMSTAQLRDSTDFVGDCRTKLGADFALLGHYSEHGDRLTVRCSLVETRQAGVLWSDSYECTSESLFRDDSAVIGSIISEVCRAIVSRELQLTRVMPIPSLENFSLYIGGITLMHRMARRDFQYAHSLFEHLSHRLPRSSAPKAMLAKWHLMRILQGWSPDPATDGRLALDFAHRSLEREPEHAFALATEGFAAAHFEDDLPLARRRCEQAIAADPQEAQAWRMLAAVHSYLGDGAAAETCAQKALALTPLDPTRFLFELVAGAAKLAAGKPTEALECATASLRRNALHLPTHRLKVIALSLGGQEQRASEAAVEMLKLSPGFRVETFERSYPGRRQPHAAQYCEALRAAGLPN